MAILVYFIAIWYILWPFGNLVVIVYIFYHFGILFHEKSGKPGWQAKLNTYKSFFQEKESGSTSKRHFSDLILSP
jgi:hypothetical protein